MKKIYGYAALFAAMSLASCSSDNEPNVVPAGAMNDAYVTVNIATPISTRAEYDYREGTTEESAVRSATFYVFDTEHKYLTSVSHTDLDWNDSDVEGIDKTSKKILKITKDAQKEVGYIMTVLNGPTLTDLTVGTTTVDEVRTKVSDYKKNGNYFVMTNSAYNATDSKNESYVPYATDVQGYVFDNIGAAQGKPCDIYVERVAARVDVKEGSKDGKAFSKEVEVAGVDAEGNEMTIKVNIDGIGFINEAVNTNLVKNIAGLDNNSAFVGWDDFANFRTHWGVNYSGFATKPLYYKDVTSSADNASNVEAYKTDTWYLNENFDSANATHIVVTGHITVNGEDAVIYTVLANGKNYLEDGAEKTLCGYLALEDYKFVMVSTEDNKTITETKSVNPENITIVPGSEDYDGYPEITVPQGYTLYKGNDPVASVSNGKLVVNENNYRVLKYGGAKNYYYAAISPAAQTKAGVVRNHIYEMTFESIGGLGVPVFDPKDELKIKDLPDTGSDDAWYFNATVNILKWTVYTQGVNFK